MREHIKHCKGFEKNPYGIPHLNIEDKECEELKKRPEFMSLGSNLRLQIHHEQTTVACAYGFMQAYQTINVHMKDCSYLQMLLQQFCETKEYKKGNFKCETQS